MTQRPVEELKRTKQLRRTLTTATLELLMICSDLCNDRSVDKRMVDVLSDRLLDIFNELK